MPRRKYSEAEKSAALESFAEAGPAEASRQTGIPKSTIAMWAAQAGVRTFGTEKTQLATEARKARIAENRAKGEELLSEVYVAFLEDAKKPNQKAGARKDLMMGAAVALDKLRLENGEATGRDEHTGKDGAPILGGVVIQLPTNGRDAEPAETTDNDDA